MKYITTALFMFLLTSVLQARVEERKFETVEQEKQYHVLINELRCLVCQNQNLADSNAELAQDLREQVYLKIKQGNSSDEIVDFMVNRYGDFVLYRPPFKASTLLLWLGPVLLLLAGFLVALGYVRKNRHQPREELGQEQREQIRKLLNDEEDN